MGGAGGEGGGGEGGGGEGGGGEGGGGEGGGGDSEGGGGEGGSRKGGAGGSGQSSTCFALPAKAKLRPLGMQQATEYVICAQWRALSGFRRPGCIWRRAHGQRGGQWCGQRGRHTHRELRFTLEEERDSLLLLTGSEV